MKIEHLTQFAKLKNYNSLNKASEELYISHQALSKTICSLEEYFQTQLIVRSSHGISFTENGRFLAERANEIATLLEQTKLHLRTNYLKKQSRKIRLYTDRISNAYLIPKILPFFKTHYSFVEFEIITIENISDNAIVFSNNFESFFSNIFASENAFGLFSFFNTELPTLELPPGITYTPIATNELFIAKKNILAPKPANTSIFVLNERELGQQSSILNFLTYEQIIYVQSQRQCYLALKNDNTGTITFKPNHYIDSYEVATDSFSKPLYLYTYTVSSDTNSEFSKTIQVLFKQLLEKE